MTSLYAVSFGPDEAPLLCVADTPEEARSVATERAEALEIATVTNPVISLEGQHPDYSDFRRQYTLMKNPHDACALGGHLFGGSDNEKMEIGSTPPERLWTLVEADDIWWICPGRHHVNRLGNLITNEPRRKEEPSYLCEGL